MNKWTVGLIVILFLFSLWVNSPSVESIPEKANLFGQELNLSGLRSTEWKPKVFGREINLSFLLPKHALGRFPIKLGLDLQGGTQLILQTQMDKIPDPDRDSALESARTVIERRVNLFGVSEALVQSSKVGSDRRILVELPGIKDLGTAASLIGSTAQLDFREYIGTPSAEATPSATEATSSGDLVINDKGELVATDASALRNPLDDFKPTGLTGADLKRAQVVFGQSATGGSGAQVQIEFTAVGAQKFSEITKRNVGKPLAMFLDDNPISWPPPVVQQEILGGSAVISGNFTSEEAKQLSIQLNAGALPVPIKVLEQRSISATLGSVSVEKSLVAGGIGLTTVMIFMILYYGIYGLIADLALIFYTLLILAIFRTGAFLIPPVTLTLAGIAGIILSIGMAVDANILTFERMKEELRSGKKGRLVLEHGFNRAWNSIRDSNISSLITATILYILGTSIVRGFALTLAIGVLVSMFSAIVVTRTFLRLMPRFKR